MKITTAAVLCLAGLPLLAACGPGEKSLRVVHTPQTKLVYELQQHEDAPHEVLGLGGSLDSAETIELACTSVEPDGVGNYEVTVLGVKLTGPPAAGANVDSGAGRPVEGDKIGANAVTLSLLPRHAVVQIAPNCRVGGAQSDLEVGKHLSEWMKTKPVASRKIIYRLAEALDAGPLVHRWWNPVSALVPPNDRVPPGTSWKSTPPPIDTPAGKLAARIDVDYTREGDVAVLTGKGSFVPDGDPPANRPLDFEGASLDVVARIDLVRGVLLSYEEKGSFDFRLRGEGKLPAPWSHTRKLTLKEPK